MGALTSGVCAGAGMANNAATAKNTALARDFIVAVCPTSGFKVEEQESELLVMVARRAESLMPVKTSLEVGSARPAVGVFPEFTSPRRALR